MSKKLLFVLSGNLSTTPRALKTILSMPKEYEHDIIVINRNNLWAKKDDKIIKEYNLKVTSINLGRQPLYPWLRATFIEKFSQRVYPFFRNHLNINAFASNKSSILLWYFLNGLDENKYDFVLGFSAGSLYPTYKFSRKWNIPFLYDVEDYHPGEHILMDKQNEVRRRRFLFKKLLPEAYVLTTASPLIADYTLKLINGHSNHRIILNGFPQNEFKKPGVIEYSDCMNKDCLNLVWFSQKISFNRGLEQLFDAFKEMHQLKNFSIKLTLIGEMHTAFREQVILPFLRSANSDIIEIEEIRPLSQVQLHSRLNTFDVGLALEPGKDLNNELALSNKIMAYAQAGLFILATDTKAQVDFLKRHPDLGIICEQTRSGINEGLKNILEILTEIEKNKNKRYNIGKSMSWDCGEGNIKDLIEIN